MPRCTVQFRNFRILLDELAETGIFRFGPVPSEGRFAIVTDVGRGMRWALWCYGRIVPRERRSRVVLVSSNFFGLRKAKGSPPKSSISQNCAENEMDALFWAGPNRP